MDRSAIKIIRDIKVKICYDEETKKKFINLKKNDILYGYVDSERNVFITLDMERKIYLKNKDYKQIDISPFNRGFEDGKNNIYDKSYAGNLNPNELKMYFHGQLQGDRVRDYYSVPTLKTTSFQRVSEQTEKQTEQKSIQELFKLTDNEMEQVNLHFKYNHWNGQIAPVSDVMGLLCSQDRFKQRSDTRLALSEYENRSGWFRLK